MKEPFCSFVGKLLCFQGSISPTFYEQLLRVQIPIEQKRQSSQAAFWLLGSAHVKASRKHIDEIDPGRSFSNEINKDDSIH